MNNVDYEWLIANETDELKKKELINEHYKYLQDRAKIYKTPKADMSVEVEENNI